MYHVSTYVVMVRIYVLVQKQYLQMKYVEHGIKYVVM